MTFEFVHRMAEPLPAEPLPEAVRDLREPAAAKAPDAATIDVTELVTRVAERTEELAEVRAGLEHAEALLEEDCAGLEAARVEAAGERYRLEVEVDRERHARAAVEADLRRLQDRLASLEHQLKIAWAQLQRDGTEAKKRPWWGGSSW